MRPLVSALLLALLAAPAAAAPPAPAAAPPVIAVPELDFTDSSGEAADQNAAHAARLAAFAATLRAGIDASGRARAVPPACDGPCTPRRTPFRQMAAAAREAGASLLLAGGVHKVSTLIGSVRLALIDLDGDRTLCERSLSYRGDTDEAWARAADFAVEDLLAHCLDAPSG